MISEMKKCIRQLAKKGFFSIFCATVVNSVVSFVYGIFIVRVLSKNDYGTFSYVQNIVNFGVLFSGIGVNLGVLQFCSEKVDMELKYSYSRFAVKVGTICSFCIAILLVVYTFVDRSNIQRISRYTFEFAYLPVLYFIKEWITSNLRWQIKNKEYGRVLNVHSITNAAFAVLGAILCGIDGVIFGIGIAYICSIVLGLYYLKDGILKNVKNAAPLLPASLEKFIKYSVVMCIVNALISVLYTIDVFVIGNIIQDTEAVAMYKTASIIPFALNMIPNSIMTFVYPHVARNKENTDWLKENIRKIYIVNGVVNLCIGVILYTVAPLVIYLFFGSRYNGILEMFRILIISYVISASLRTPAANLFGILRKTKTALMISAGTVVISTCMSISLVRKYGIIGATYGSVATFSIVGIISTVILVKEIYFKSNRENVASK